MSRKRIRLMCVDDNQLVADAVKRRIEFEPRFEWVGWASSLDGVRERIATERPDVILLDIDMPGDSFELLRDVSLQTPNSRVVMFSGYVQNDYIDRAIENGAWGYVSKNASIDEVLAAVEQVAAGEFALSPEANAEQWRGEPARDVSFS